MSMGLTWKMEQVFVVSGSEPLEKHTFVFPLNDAIEHDPYEYSCPCMPDYKMHIGIHPRTAEDDGACVCTWFELTHHSLDGRELSE